MNNPTFDKHQFDNRRNRPVSRETQISWEDYAGMSTHSRKPSGERRLPTPRWAVNDELLKELLAAFMEDRAMVRPLPGTISERLDRAAKRIEKQRSGLESTLIDCCKEYASLQSRTTALAPARESRAPGEPINFPANVMTANLNRRKRILQQEIEGLDTYLRYTATERAGADVIASVVYLYYRVCLDSVGVGAQLNLKPPHVRQILWRLNQTWIARFDADKKSGEPDAVQYLE